MAMRPHLGGSLIIGTLFRRIWKIKRIRSLFDGTAMFIRVFV
jgi:hypothetical protein